MNVPNEKIQEVSKYFASVEKSYHRTLVEEGWSSLHSVIEEKRFWEVIDQLKKAWSRRNSIIPIEKNDSIILQLLYNFYNLQLSTNEL